MQSTRNTTPSDEFFPSDAVLLRCYGGATEVRLSSDACASEVLVRCVGGASESENGAPQTQFGLLSNTEMDMHQTSSTTPIQIRCFQLVVQPMCYGGVGAPTHVRLKCL